MKRAIKKILKNLGVELEKDQINELTDELTEAVNDEVKAKTPKPKDEPFDTEKFKQELLAELMGGKKGKSDDDDGKSEIESLKEQHAKELTNVKLQGKVDAELSGLKVKEGYLDIVKNLIDFEKVKLNDKGVLEGLKEQTDALIKDKTELFGQVKGYEPKHGNNPVSEQDFDKAKKSENFNFTDFVKNNMGSDE